MLYVARVRNIAPIPPVPSPPWSFRYVGAQPCSPDVARPRTRRRRRSSTAPVPPGHVAWPNRLPWRLRSWSSTPDTEALLMNVEAVPCPPSTNSSITFLHNCPCLFVGGEVPLSAHAHRWSTSTPLTLSSPLAAVCIASGYSVLPPTFVLPVPFALKFAYERSDLLLRSGRQAARWFTSVPILTATRRCARRLGARR